MEQKFSNNGLDLQVLREFCEREGEEVTYRKGDQLEREGDPARITWFSFAGEFVADYPTFLYDHPSQTTIVAMMPSHIFRVTGEQVRQFFGQSMETMTLRAIIAEHILGQFRSRYLELQRYESLLQRCPGIVEHLPLNAISSFLCITPQMLSRIRKDITFNGK